MPEISVIVPVYRTAQHIGRCLDSILAQTFEDFEVLVLNDESPDDAEDIIAIYAQKDDRIRYYKHPNRGVGPTRNRGINLAQGNYLAFVDSDDYILPNMLASLYEAIKKADAEVAVGETYLVEEGTQGQEEKRTLKHKLPRISLELNEENMEAFMKEYYFTRKYSYNAWDKLMLTSFVKNNHIEFGDIRRVFAEDNFFQVQVLNYVQRITFVDEPVYCYIQHPQSIMHTARKEILVGQLHFIHDLMEKFRGENKHWLRKSLSVILFDSLKAQSHNSAFYHTNQKKALEVLKEDLTRFRNDSYYPEFRKFFLDEEAFRLDGNRYRRHHMQVVSRLLDQNRLRLATFFLYAPYWVRSRQ